VARLQHPNIVQIHEIGEADGYPFFSLEFCPGGSLAGKLNGTPLPPAQAAPLVEALARAMQAAHEAGVIHRDLKPANVLLLADGTPRVTDFGLAKKLDDAAGQTASGAIMGTPSYMAPEQAEGKKDIGPAADVYALGAVLYELLTGRPPFKAATSLDTVLQVVSEEPVPPGRLVAKLPRDLETICLKCLHKEPWKRYPSAADLATDLGHFQRGEPIRARPVGRAERAWRWCRRNPVVAGLVGAVAGALLLGAGVATLFGVQAQARAREATAAKDEATRKAAEEKRAREAADEARHQAEWLAYAGQIALAQREWQDNEVGHASALLDACQRNLRGWEHAYLRHLCASNQQTLKGHARPVLSVCWSPDGTRLASAGGIGFYQDEVKVWDAASGRQNLSLPGHKNLVSSVCWSPDGKRLASAEGRGAPVEVKVWDLTSGREALSFKGHITGVNSLCWSPDGKRLAGGGSFFGFPPSGEIKVWDAATGQETLSLKGHAGQVASVCWSPDGTRLASASYDGTVKVWDAEHGHEALTLKGGHSGGVLSVCWSPDGTRLASGSVDQTVRVWDVASGQQVLTLKGHIGSVTSVRWSPDSTRLASGSSDKTVKVWDAATGLEAVTPQAHTDPVTSVCWSPDSTRLASASGQDVKVWNAARAKQVHALSGGGDRVCWSPDGRRLASASGNQTVKVWDAASSVEALTFSMGRGTGRGPTFLVNSMCWSPDGKRLAGGGLSLSSAQEPYGEVKVWDAATGQETLSLRHTVGVRSVCWSPDGTRLASGDGRDGEPGEVRVWDAASGQQALSLRGHTDPIWAVCWSPDGTRLATASIDRTVKVWDAASGQQVLTLKGHAGAVTSVCWSPDGKRLASGGGGIRDELCEVKVWDAAGGQQAFTLKGHTKSVWAVCWSPDGTRLATAGADHTVKVWDAERGRESLTLKGHTGDFRDVCWSPDGTRLAGAGSQEVKVWEAAGEKP
jgi:WD40 repeat protein